jgi:hypothetical protein
MWRKAAVVGVLSRCLIAANALVCSEFEMSKS